MSADQLDHSLQFIEGYESFWSFCKTKKGTPFIPTSVINWKKVIQEL